MKSNTLVTIIADYGDLHDLAFAEVRERLYAELNDDKFVFETIAIPAFDTVATGFVVAQLGLNSRLGSHHKFYVNTAPRKDDLNPRVKNAGEGLVYARLPGGAEIVAVNAGCSLSFVREHAVELKNLKVSAEGSQFRSRDVFPSAFAKIAHGNHSDITTDLEGVPDIPRECVCYTDGYGNLKTTVDMKALAAMKGRNVVISINGKEEIASVAAGIFEVKDGELVVSPGSSGWDGRYFTEIVRRGGNAARSFGNPAGGAKVEWRPVA